MGFDTVLFHIERTIMWIGLRTSMRFQVKGRANVPADGAFLLISNHLSYADPPVIAVSMGRRVTFMAKEELFRNWAAGRFLLHLGAIPVHRGHSNRDALRQGEAILKKGKILAMFPEGKRSTDRRLQTGLPGSVLMAYHDQVPILPVAVVGTEKIHGLGWIWRRPLVQLFIGEPFDLPEVKVLNKEKLEELTLTIMARIAQLLPEEYQGKSENRE